MAYNSIDPARDYDPAVFKTEFGKVSTLENIAKGLKEDSANPELIKAAGGILVDNPTAFAGQAPDLTREHLNEAHAEGLEGIMGYVGNNVDALLGEVDTNGYLALLRSLKLEKTGDEEKDKAIDALNNAAKLQTQLRTPEGEEAYLQVKVGSMPSWFKKAYAYSASTESYRTSLLKSFASADLAKAERALVDDEGQIKEAYVKELFEASLDVAKADPAKAAPYYQAIALIAHKQMSS